MSASPFYWKEKDGWYIWTRTPQNKRKRVFLAKTKREAMQVWKAGTAEIGKSPTFDSVATGWLERQGNRQKRGEVSLTWLNRVMRTVDKFLAAYPTIRCDQITPKVATDWLDSPSIAYESTEVNVLKQILKWAVDEQLITRSPLATMKLSKGNRREAILSIDGHRRLVAATPNPRIRSLLWFAWWTGSRPIELRDLRWEQLSRDCTTAVLIKHKTARKTQKARVLYFPPNAAKLLRTYRSQAEGELVFLNSRGRKWTKDAIVCLLRRLRAKTGSDATAYAYRHSYATRAIEQGVGVADLAEILGTSIEVISRNYAHLDKSKSRLAGIANRVR